MYILVVKTSRGDVYFGNCNAPKIWATELACEEVLRDDGSGYRWEDRREVQSAKDDRDYGRLYKALVACGAIRQATVDT